MGYSIYRSDNTIPASNGAVVVPDDDDELAFYCRSLYIGIAGDVAVQFVEGNTMTFTNVPVGILPVSVKKVLDTGTTADEIVALW